MNLSRFIFLTCLLVSSHSAFALKSDSEQPVYIDSNSASYDEKKGLSIYIGNVVTVQGSLHIDSDKLVVYVTDGEIKKMVFTGKPTRFRQLPGIGKDEIYGEGLTGEYYPEEHRLVLIKEAIVSQGSNRSASGRITYDSENSLIQAGEKSSDRTRVHSVFKAKGKALIERVIKGEVEKRVEDDEQDAVSKEIDVLRSSQKEKSTDTVKKNVEKEYIN
ncbi:MAG: lipopolysaccharide transport periplasmic protein LptA [Methylococcales bacterium]|nr:lipopolysaccharide transport periplasmic protein LptA [Methylococcales bacterium]